MQSSINTTSGIGSERGNAGSSSSSIAQHQQQTSGTGNSTTTTATTTTNTSTNNQTTTTNSIRSASISAPIRQSSIPMANALLSTVNAARQRQPMCAECEKSLPNQIVFDKIESIIRLMQDEQNGLPVKTAKSFMSKIPSVFTGTDLIQWMMKNLKLEDLQEAVHLANLIASHGYIFPIEDHTLSIKNDCTFYRFQTPCLWPSNNCDPENTDYAVYLCKRTMQGKTRLELADYEAENLARLQKMFSRKWEFIFMQAESQAKVDKKRDKLERKVLDSQERAFWDVYRPVPGCVNTTELDIKKACRLSKSAKRCGECQKVTTTNQPVNSSTATNSSSGAGGGGGGSSSSSGSARLGNNATTKPTTTNNNQTSEAIEPSKQQQAQVPKSVKIASDCDLKSIQNNDNKNDSLQLKGSNKIDGSDEQEKENTTSDSHSHSHSHSQSQSPAPSSSPLPFKASAELSTSFNNKKSSSSSVNDVVDNNNTTTTSLELETKKIDLNLNKKELDCIKATTTTSELQLSDNTYSKQSTDETSSKQQQITSTSSNGNNKQQQQQQKGFAGHHHHQHHHHHHHHHHHPHQHQHGQHQHQHAHHHHHHHHHRQCPHHKHQQQQHQKQEVADSEKDLTTQATTPTPTSESMPKSTSNSNCRKLLVKENQSSTIKNNNEDDPDGDNILMASENSNNTNKDKDKNIDFVVECKSKRPPSVGSTEFSRAPSIGSGACLKSASSRRKSECNRMYSMNETTTTTTISASSIASGEGEKYIEQDMNTSCRLSSSNNDSNSNNNNNNNNKNKFSEIRPASACCSYSSLQQQQALLSNQRSASNQSNSSNTTNAKATNQIRKNSLNIIHSADQLNQRSKESSNNRNVQDNDYNNDKLSSSYQLKHSPLKETQSVSTLEMGNQHSYQINPSTSKNLELTGNSSSQQQQQQQQHHHHHHSSSLHHQHQHQHVNPTTSSSSAIAALITPESSSSSNINNNNLCSIADRQNIGLLERELEALKLRLDRRIGGVKMSKVTQSYLSYFKQWAEYDPFIAQPIPSNPWISDSTELWDSERQTKDVHFRRVRRWAFSLKELLNDPAGREQFHKFLEKEFSAENLKFWDAVQELKRVHSRDVARRVEAIWTEYLAPDANCPINIDSKSYETSKKNMAKNKNNRYIFDEAAGHVYQLMKNDSYPRYLRSDMYKDYKEASEKRRTNQVAFDVFKPQITTLKHKFNF